MYAFFYVQRPAFEYSLRFMLLTDTLRFCLCSRPVILKTLLGMLLGQISEADSLNISFAGALEWKLMSCTHCQKLGQLANLASDWLFTLVSQ